MTGWVCFATDRSERPRDMVTLPNPGYMCLSGRDYLKRDVGPPNSLCLVSLRLRLVMRVCFGVVHEFCGVVYVHSQRQAAYTAWGLIQFNSRTTSGHRSGRPFTQASVLLGTCVCVCVCVSVCERERESACV